MNTKKALQIVLLIVIMLSSFVTTRAAHAAPSCGTSYTVISGDTLRKIATKCDTTVYALRRGNPEIGSGNLIYPGQILLLPGAIIYGGNGYNTYLVARGDTLKSLANRFGTDMNTLLSLNPDITNANVIYEGQRLVVPAQGGVVTPPPSNNTYVIQRGDTLRKIAARFNTTVDAILQVNPQISNPNRIYVGQVINLPASATSTYVVQQGDTLKIIAAKFGTTLQNLLALNPQITNPDKIYVGQVIRIW